MNTATAQLDGNLAVADPQAEPRLVEGVARILAVVPSLGPAGRAWSRLGFKISEPFEFMGCRAADLQMRGSAIRFLAPDYRRREHTVLASMVDDRLILGAGILGWSWVTTDVDRTHSTLTDGLETPDERNSDTDVVALPTALTPGVSTLLEQAPRSADRSADGIHPNAICDLHHVVLGMSDADRAADVYAESFRLRALRRKTADRRYVFLEAGDSSIEIVGPAEPQRGQLTGHAWGLAFRSSDLDATLASLHARQVDVPEPQTAVQGTRAASLPIHLGGIGIAFVGE